MNIQGMGQSYIAYQSMNMRGTQSSSGGFEPPVMDAASIMENEDANVDGVLTLDETRLSEDMFSNADTNADGQLTTEELEEMLSSPPPMMGRGMGGMGGMGGMNAASIMEKEDTDGSGSISIEETVLPEQVFSELDTNQDGLVSLEELEQGMAEKQKESDSTQGTSFNRTVTQDSVASAYRQAMESFMINFTESHITNASLGKFPGAIA